MRTSLLLMAIMYLALSATDASAQATKLMIFGGDDHKVYLGCLNCSQYAVDSVHNEYNSYGSQYSATSIFNRYGVYGSPYSNTSACNQYANQPPAIVDSDGNFYGRLTLNEYHPQASKNETLVAWLTNSVCHH